MWSTAESHCLLRKRRCYLLHTFVRRYLLPRGTSVLVLRFCRQIDILQAVNVLCRCLHPLHVCCAQGFHFVRYTKSPLHLCVVMLISWLNGIGLLKLCWTSHESILKNVHTTVMVIHFDWWQLIAWSSKPLLHSTLIHVIWNLQNFNT
jgi:hypothetical protein